MLKTLCLQNQQSGRRVELASPTYAKDAEYVTIIEEFTTKFKRKVKSCVVRKVSEKLRCGLLQAAAQSFILSILM